MNDAFLKVIILGLPVGFSLMWFAYWVVKIFKARHRALGKRTPGSAPGRPPDVRSPSDG